MVGNLCGMLKKGGARPAHRCPASPNSTGETTDQLSRVRAGGEGGKAIQKLVHRAIERTGYAWAARSLVIRRAETVALVCGKAVPTARWSSPPAPTTRARTVGRGGPRPAGHRVGTARRALFAQLLTAHCPRSADFGPSAVGRTSKSKIPVGR